MKGVVRSDIAAELETSACGHVERAAAGAAERIASAPESTFTEPGVVEGRRGASSRFPVPVLTTIVPALFKMPGPPFKNVVFPSSVSWPFDMLLNVPGPFKVVPEATVALPELSIVQPVKTMVVVLSIVMLRADGIESVPEPLK